MLSGAERATLESSNEGWVMKVPGHWRVCQIRTSDDQDSRYIAGWWVFGYSVEPEPSQLFPGELSYVDRPGDPQVSVAVQQVDHTDEGEYSLSEIVARHISGALRQATTQAIIHKSNTERQQ